MCATTSAPVCALLRCRSQHAHVRAVMHAQRAETMQQNELSISPSLFPRPFSQCSCINICAFVRRVVVHPSVAAPSVRPRPVRNHMSSSGLPSEGGRLKHCDHVCSLSIFLSSALHPRLGNPSHRHPPSPPCASGHLPSRLQADQRADAHPAGGGQG